jgi:hypothetical protein|tara:strand:+ start:7824 stop:8000 length:177 start_codon:yes stop_codon:yes gene_type:complete
MSKIEQIPKEFLEISEDLVWKPCMYCGFDEILQVRKALFTCGNCNFEFISDEKDMVLG